MKPYQLTASELHPLLCKGKLSAREVVLSCLDRIKCLESKVHAWTYLNEELVLAQADAIDTLAAQGVAPRPLFGIPVGVKDIFNTSDMPTCMGSPIWNGFTPGNDARVVEEMRYNHALIMGKTVTAEFAVHFPGKTVNPHNPKHTPGTSSSGSAVAVACRMVPVAIGTQTAGSTIRPASFNGIFGYKPSFGLIPRTGILKTLDTLDHVTLFARCLSDIRMFLDVLRVRGRNYPFVHQTLDNYSPFEPDRKFKVGFVKTHVWDVAENYVQEAMADFLGNLAALDRIELAQVDLPHDFDTIHDVHSMIYEKSLSYYFNEEYEKYGDQISPVMKEMVKKGRGHGQEEFFSSLGEQNRLSTFLDTFFADNDYDVLISHSTAHDAPEGLHTIEKRDPCLMWTLCRVPTMNLPLFRSPRGLPFGAQIIARRYEDYRMFDFVSYLEREGVIPPVPNPDIP